jgi:hypothetical protein
MSRLAPRTLCVVAVVLLATVLGAAAPGAAQSTQTVAGTQLAPDDVSLRIDIRENTSAVWEVEYRILLDDENATTAFESVKEDARNNESQFTSEFHHRMDATAQTAENATGREMDVRNVSVTVSRQQLPQEYGVVTYRFVWTNFAVVDGDEIRAGDALEGLFLDEQTSLLVTWPEGYVAEGVRPDPDDRRTRTVVWNGPFDFGSGEPSITLTPQADAAATTEAAAGDGDAAGPDDSGGPNLWVVGAGLLFAVAVVGGGLMFYRRGGPPFGRPRPDDDGGAAVTTAAAGGATADRTDPTETSGRDGPSTDETAGASRTADAGPTDAGPTDEPAATPGAEGGAEAESDDTPPWEDELLSNEERVLALIEHEGGRLKQQEVAGTLDWTDAKTSQVVRKMRDEDRLDAFRLGRENVLVLPDEDGEGELM